MTSTVLLRRRISSLILGLFCPLAPALAQSDIASPADKDIRSGERLSSWLIRHQPASSEFPLATAWYLPAAIREQAVLKQDLLLQLELNATRGMPPDQRQHWKAWLNQAPVTGRVVLPATDPRWMQAHPEQNPVLDHDHRVSIAPRPETVLVLNADGTVCAVSHRSGAEAKDYLHACQPEHSRLDDLAYVIQPDGQVQAVTLSAWNQAEQDEPAPGALIWAPTQAQGWSPKLAAGLARFLSTQEPGFAQKEFRTFAPITSMPERMQKSRDPMYSANDWGTIGLLQMPTARMQKTGDIRLSLSHTQPYTRANILMQPFDWLEGGFRYSDISNRLYGTDIAGTQSYKDKSLDIKVRLAEESVHRPQIALGVIDIGGTGLFSSEYLVASKRWGNFDWTLGMAWGYLGGSNNIHNPLSNIFGKSFNSRPATDSAGAFNTSAFFHGNTALFGGVQYQVPDQKIILKLEYDGNNYRNEPLNNLQDRKSPINVGVVYQYSPNLDMGFGLERGNTLMFSLNFHGGLDKLTTPKLLDPVTPKVSAERPDHEPNWDNTVADIQNHTKWRVIQIRRTSGELRLDIEEAQGYYWKDRLERIAAILHRDAPADINRFVLSFKEHGIAMTERVILRDAWIKDYLQYQAAVERFAAIAATEPSTTYTASSVWRDTRGPFKIGLAPSYQNSFGGPDGFVLFQLGAAIPMELRITDKTWITASGNVRLVDNYDKFKYDAPSNLPRVRTFVREYLTTSRATLPVFQINHLEQWGNNHYFNYYAGALESMFAGYGAEWLYRPWHKSVAFGIDFNQVRQRDFHQNFSLRDYKVNTGHGTLYWDTGWNSTHINLSGGQYLAGDRGFTVDINRTFLNGVTLGAWATKTNVSATTFGEGGFDKGIYLRIPFDAMLPITSPSLASFTWNPLTRDGGAKLGRSNALYDLTSARDKRLTRYTSRGIDNAIEIDDERSLWPGDRSPFDGLGNAVGDLGKAAGHGDLNQSLLLGGAIVLGSSILDRPLAKWADNHQSSRWNALGRVSNSLTYVLAGGTGILWLGAGDDIAADTAWTAIKSSLLTVGVESMTKFSVGRARPGDDLGNTHFDGFSRQAASSSFPSFHSGVAFSLVTPFAQRYDAPWLYGLAAASTFGRVQQRQHYTSDVVAGSLIGYGLGSFMLSRQQAGRNGPQVFLGADRSIYASWDLD